MSKVKESSVCAAAQLHTFSAPAIDSSHTLTWWLLKGAAGPTGLRMTGVMGWMIGLRRQASGVGFRLGGS